ncbi:MAG: NADH-quinone oxidoreductase subunit C [Desulfitobacteriaceae bacterium]|nr:NADH-quinone oxidoreductase subunit C [Desulfitobacteriaceae bacterium]MDI6879698.1 NADH-quinone oxidoreductase subunit C [Desulfitobacteriaceae bacterium]MDI6915143.1 NADH-quinone oxidoreductase subunit C [Desulfitobacteriaceae bacterium]
MTRLEMATRIKDNLSQLLSLEVKLPTGSDDVIHLETAKENLSVTAGYLYKEQGCQLVQMLGNDEREICGSLSVYLVFVHDGEGLILILRVAIAPEDLVYPSVTPVIPAAHWYEREIRDLYGLEPKGHPQLRRLAVHKDWPKQHYPLRRDFPLTKKVPRSEGEFKFIPVEGEGVMQIPVGPIHAGIIEPGHFRFSVVGENVLHLEARFFYTHRGMEKLAEGKTPQEGLLIAERICGACSFSHSLAYCLALEKLTETAVSERVDYIRTLGMELERLYNHIGDVGNICAGIGFAFGTMQGARLKEKMQQLNETVFGSRFLRGINTPGGVRRDLNSDQLSLILQTLSQVEGEFRELTEILLASESYLNRVQGTGLLRHDIASELHAVGPAARASGVDRDLRRDHPYAAYAKLAFRVPVLQEGDVLARVKLRIEETFESMGIIRQVLASMPEGELKVALKPLPAYAYAVGMTESARGENVHFVMAGQDGRIFRHMVRSASYCNWPVVPSTVPGNIVPDFPLINKSFELCYSCLDR